MVTTVAPRRKKPVLPEGVDQLTFFTSLTPVSPVLSPVKRQRHPRKPKAEGVQQLDIFSLISDAFEPEQLDLASAAQARSPKPKTRRMPHVHPRQADQLTFESMAEASAKDVPAIPAGEPLARGAGENG